MYSLEGGMEESLGADNPASEIIGKRSGSKFRASEKSTSVGEMDVSLVRL